MGNPFARDLILLHSPAIYDFRTTHTFLGPVADAVPSTTMFEMYPVGLTSIASFLESNNYNVEIVNLAYRMLRDPGFDVEAHLRHMSAPVFGIDLHWLPHVQGALAIMELVKRLHPESRILVGGLSASYYHEELVRYPFVDFVLRGDSTEEPVRQLLQALRESTPLERIENLTWKRPDGSIAVNRLTFVPADLDYVDVPAYRYLLRSLFKYRSLGNLVPCLEWLRYPVTLLITARGCTQNCAICGGSRSAYQSICSRQRPAFRSPEKLAEDVRVISSFSRAPIFVVHDPRMGGMRRARRFFSLLEEMRPANEMVFELFYPADDELFELVSRSVPTWSIEMTLESPDEVHRRRNGKFPHSNAAVESTIGSALAHGCRKLDVFFMVGLPDQRCEDALGIVGPFDTGSASARRCCAAWPPGWRWKSATPSLGSAAATTSLRPAAAATAHRGGPWRYHRSTIPAAVPERLTILPVPDSPARTHERHALPWIRRPGNVEARRHERWGPERCTWDPAFSEM